MNPDWIFCRLKHGRDEAAILHHNHICLKENVQRLWVKFHQNQDFQLKNVTKPLCHSISYFIMLKF